MIRTTVLAALSVSVLAVALPAAAQSAPAARDAWSFELGAGTDNRSKDASKSGNDGYAFGSATWESADGLFYVGPGFQTIQAGGSNVEAEFVVGYQPEAFGYRFDFNVAYKNRLDADAGYDQDAWEITGNVSRSIGPAKARLQVQYSPDAAGSADSFTWVEGRLGWDFTPQLSGTVAVGRREQNGAPDYTGWNAGVTYALTDALDLDLRYYDTDAHTFGEQYEDALVAKVAYAF
ncbi:TorF family putative porin [Brevundimonas vesicularis]|uniref:TorF family putative porin n=1 Tax=Brevundimonas vesicularis TaxID=41276 RepID=UPI0022AC2070|nr:TorF family putative porin [Brevundimonas vesicularis]